MGRGSRGSGNQIVRRPVDLTGILSVAEKNDFIFLVNAITEDMLKNLSNMFDSPPVRPALGEYEQRHWLSLPLLRHGDDNKENLLNDHAFSGIAKETSSTTYAKPHQIVQVEANKDMAPRLGELKKEALGFFKKWQLNVLQRLKEINVNDLTSSTSVSRSRGRGSRGGYRASRGGRGGRGGPVALTLAIGMQSDYHDI
jgi:hypothetical protein